jgi:hypothetical protein
MHLVRVPDGHAREFLAEQPLSIGSRGQPGPDRFQFGARLVAGEFEAVRASVER